MSPKRLVILFLAMAGASLLMQMWLKFAGVSGDVRAGAGMFAMAMTAWLVEKQWIQENLLLGRSFATWFFGTLAIAVVINILMWRFWPR